MKTRNRDEFIASETLVSNFESAFLSFLSTEEIQDKLRFAVEHKVSAREKWLLFEFANALEYGEYGIPWNLERGDSKNRVDLVFGAQDLEKPYMVVEFKATVNATECVKGMIEDYESLKGWPNSDLLKAKAVVGLVQGLNDSSLIGFKKLKPDFERRYEFPDLGLTVVIFAWYSQ